MKTLRYIFILVICTISLQAQNGTMDAENGIIVGSNSGTEAGTIRWNGSDFQGYDGTEWISLTDNGVIASLLEDEDGDTEIDLEGSGDEDIIHMKTNFSTVFLLDKEDLLYIGKDAGSENPSALGNTGIGFQTMRNIETGDGNSSLGNSALQSIDSGSFNLALGYFALKNFKNGVFNLAAGPFALENMTNGERNIALGYDAMKNADSTTSNIAIGKGSLFEVSGNFNTALGESSLKSLDNGSHNVGIGYLAGQNVDSASSGNVMIGQSAGRGGFDVPSSKHEKHNNVIIGKSAGFNYHGDASVMLGHRAGQNASKDNTLYIENTSGDSSEALIYGEFDNDLLLLNADVLVKNGVTIGNSTSTTAGTLRWTGSDFEIYNGTNWISVTGTSALLEDSDGDTRLDLEGTGDDDFFYFISESDTVGIINNSNYLFLGANAGTKAMTGTENTGVGNNALSSISSGLGNTAFGSGALSNVTTAPSNTAIGRSALGSNETGTTNSAVGSWSLLSLRDGDNNVAMGYRAMQYADSCNGNVALGTGAMVDVIGNFNVGIGSSALSNVEDGTSNVAIGYLAGWYVEGSSSNNVLIGKNTGRGGLLSLTARHTKHDNVIIGNSAGYNYQGDASVMLGNEAGYNETKNNTLYIENTSGDSSEALIYGEFDNDLLRFNAQVEVHKNSGSGTPQLLLKEYGTDGARIIMDNDQNENYWTIFGRPYTNSGSSQINFHYQDSSGEDAQSGNKFRIFGDGDAFLYHSNSGGAGGLRLINGSNPTEYWRLYTSSSSGDLRFYSNDSTNARAWINDLTGVYSSASDERVKNNIESLPSILNRTLLLNAKSYWYNGQASDENKTLGFLAQEANELFPELVSYQEDDDMYGINYAGFSVVAIKAIQEQQETIEAQQKALNNLTDTVKEQDKKIEFLLEQNALILNKLGQE